MCCTTAAAAAEDLTMTDATKPALPWYQQPVTDALAGLGSSPAGLDSTTAAARLAEYGPNELVDRGGKHPLRMLWEQFTAVMVLILIAAALLSLGLGKLLEAGAILAIVVLFAVLGFIQEYRAERAIAALKRLAVPVVRVWRGGRLTEVDSRSLVPGDVVALEAGNLVPADLRLIEAANLRIQEAALTGESEPVEKHSAVLSAAEPPIGETAGAPSLARGPRLVPIGETAGAPSLARGPRLVPIGDRVNMAYLGTVVTYGRGVGLVVATGMGTELGRIATLLQDVKTGLTPLQARLDRVGKQLAAGGVLVALLILAIGLAAGESLTDMVLTAISVAVAVIPEGLPAVVTVTLALGAQRMLRRQALVRKLPAVETLGSVTVICSDKTGTLTENRMTVTALDTVGHRIDLSERLRHGEPTVEPAESRTGLPGDAPPLALLLAGGGLCNDAVLQRDDDSGRLTTVGDPTEGALLVAAARDGLDPAELASAMPRVAELPFDSERKRMTTVHARAAAGLPAALAAVWGRDGFEPQANYLAITKGAVDGLLEISTRVWVNGQAVPLDETQRRRIDAGNRQLAGNGMRVLGVAFRTLVEPEPVAAVERELVFVGLIGMIDPPRAEVRAAVQTCQTAGIRPVMITGDHPLTAAYIARELGLAHDPRVLTGIELERLSPTELAAATREVAVFARVSPEHKLRIVEALRDQGEVVAMTGDGVNDAPALKKADIGVAMGITGTDVAKEAAAMVLRDDNFASIVAAVEEGRVIYDNLKRFVKFAVAGNLGKVLVMLAWPLPFVALGLPLEAAVALLPLQLLWLNLMTDGLLGLSMGVERAERDVMQRPPHDPRTGLFGDGAGWQVLWVGTLIGLLALGVGFGYYRAGAPEWQTMIFLTLGFAQVFQALATRSNSESVFAMGLRGNRTMATMIALVTGLQLAAVYLPWLQGPFLRLVPPTGFDLAVSIALGSVVLLAIELDKALRRRRRPADTVRPGRMIGQE
jgi:Ca2+-transporting ATPase